jgi:hypothetical protein
MRGNESCSGTERQWDRWFGVICLVVADVNVCYDKDLAGRKDSSLEVVDRVMEGSLVLAERGSQ